MRIGLFGGAFNPVHNGHLALAHNYLDSLELDRILFIPTSIPPHKTADNLASMQDRLNMLSLAFDDEPRFDYTDIEFHRQGKSYTYDTILELKRIYPDDDMFLIVGSDQFFYFQNWYRADDILSMVTVVTAARENEEYGRLLDFKSQYPNMASTIVSNFSVVEVSSSEIRDGIKAGESISHLVPPAVNEYIKEHSLYV